MKTHAHNQSTYAAAIINLRILLASIGRQEFKAYGYATQLRSYRKESQAKVTA